MRLVRTDPGGQQRDIEITENSPLWPLFGDLDVRSAVVTTMTPRIISVGKKDSFTVLSITYEIPNE